MTNKFTVSVVGGGAVGRAVAAYYGDIKVYDKYHPRDPITEAAAADYIFIAVPTPFNNGPDLTEIDDAVANVAAHLVRPQEQIVIIKSTVVPGTTDAYQQKYPQVNFVFNPEFLTEKVAAEDFAKPDKQLIGHTAKTKGLAERVAAILPPAPYQKILPAKTCEMIKYTINTYYAFKVIFANTFYDLCQKQGEDYNLVREGLMADRRICDSHFDVLHGGYRGYGGKCLPKDVRTLAWLAREQGVDFQFVQAVIALNDKLSKDQNL